MNLAAFTEEMFEHCHSLEFIEVRWKIMPVRKRSLCKGEKEMYSSRWA